MFKKNNYQPNFGSFDERTNYSNNQNMSIMYPDFQFERFQYEIKENRRRINNLAKRIIRIENYLRIRDTSDYVVNDEDSTFPL